MLYTIPLNIQLYGLAMYILRNVIHCDVPVRHCLCLTMCILRNVIHKIYYFSSVTLSSLIIHILHFSKQVEIDRFKLTIHIF